MGGSAGIGFAAAHCFAEAGARVAIAARRQAQLGGALAELPSQRCSGHSVDGTNAEELGRFFAGFESIDHLVISFGSSGDSGPFGAGASDLARSHLEEKFLSHLCVLEHALPVMALSGSVTIVTGGAAETAYAGTLAWAAADGAMQSIIPTLAVELAPLRVNAVAPGIVDTQWWQKVSDDEREAKFAGFAQASAVGRVGTPHDVGHAIRFLAENTFVTGIVLTVDGGAHLKRRG